MSKGDDARSGPSVRTRVLAAVLGVAAIGMLVTGVVSFLVQRERVDDRIDDQLAQEVDEFRGLAGSGIDPQTGMLFGTVDRLLVTALQQNVPDGAEGLITLIDGEIHRVPGSNVNLRLEDDPAFVRAAAAVPADAAIRARTFDSPLGTLRYVSVPVQVRDDPTTGRYVIAYARELEYAPVADSYRTYALVALISLIVIGAVGWSVAGRLLQPVRLLRETAQRISDTDLSGRIPVTGNDDVTELARTVNAMLDRLEAAFAAHREALDDAGHELRTPITIIRGHLELMDAGDPADVEETRALALDELDRMHRLVDELVLLAKARRPDFIRTRPADIGRLVDDVLDKARPLADRRWRIDARPDLTADVDEQRMTQALLQLVSNAVKYTGPNDTVAVGARAESGRLLLWVRDTGRGVSAPDAARIFDRFVRVEGGRGVEGSGLGLAIVRAIAEAHGGRVLLDSAPGRGATFTLEIPATGVVADDHDDETTEAVG